MDSDHSCGSSNCECCTYNLIVKLVEEFIDTLDNDQDKRSLDLLVSAVIFSRGPNVCPKEKLYIITRLLADAKPILDRVRRLQSPQLEHKIFNIGREKVSELSNAYRAKCIAELLEQRRAETKAKIQAERILRQMRVASSEKAYVELIAAEDREKERREKRTQKKQRQKAKKAKKANNQPNQPGQSESQTEISEEEPDTTFSVEIVSTEVITHTKITRESVTFSSTRINGSETHVEIKKEKTFAEVIQTRRSTVTPVPKPRAPIPKSKGSLLCESCEITKTFSMCGKKFVPFNKADFEPTDNSTNNSWLQGIMNRIDPDLSYPIGFSFEFDVKESRYGIELKSKTLKQMILIQSKIHNEYGRSVLFDDRWVRIKF